MNSDTLVLITVTFFAMMSPGPDMLLLIRNALSGDRSYGLATVLGIAAGLMIHTSLAVLGLALVLQTNALAFTIAKLLGAGYLVYLGISALRGACSAQGSALRDACAANGSNLTSVAALRPSMTGFKQGLFCNALNPKVSLFVLALFTQFVSLQATSTERIFVATIVIGEALVVWSLFVLLIRTAAVKRALLRLGRVLDAVFGLAMLGLGLRLAVAKS